MAFDDKTAPATLFLERFAERTIPDTMVAFVDWDVQPPWTQD